MYIKYPRTPHLPCSPGATSDDKKLSEEQLEAFYCGNEIVITEKMDGENTSMYSNYIHARSIDSRHHPSRNWVKRYHSELAHNIPDKWRICGENMFAQHSISYDNLDSYFYGISIWDENNICLSWDETLRYFNLLGIQPVPVVFPDITHNVGSPMFKKMGEQLVAEGKEGFVMRAKGSFNFRNFDKKVAKYVRANHVQTDNHWMNSQMIPNKLKGI